MWFQLARRKGRGGAALQGRPALPCLLSNNCTTEEKTEPLNILKGGHKRMAQVLFLEIMALVAFYGIERIGFFTLTFADHVTSLREAQRRFRSIRAHVIVKRHERAIVVWERHESGRIHFHLVVVLAEDIRTGADFAAFKRKDYRSANRALRGEWAFWRVTCPKYGFGRHELMPIKSNAQGIARYVGKYIAKHMLMARYKAQRMIEERPVTRTVLDQGESFNGWPVWAVPASFGEQVASTPLSPEIVREGEERAREMRLYAARLEVLDGRNLGRWE